MRSNRAAEALTIACALAAVAVFELLPLVVLGADLAGAAGRAGELLASWPLWALFLRSVARAALVTLGALALGVPLGFVFSRTDVPARRLLFGLHVFPMFLPPFLLALGWFHLLGRSGLVGSEASSRLLFGEPGAVAIQILAFSPAVTALVMLGLAGLDPSLEDAGRVLASPWRVATRISLPLVAPSVALGGLIVFALALAELGVPMFLGVKAYPAAVFARLGAIDFNPGEAMVLTLPLAAVALVMLAVERRIARRPVAMTGLSFDRPSLNLGRARLPLGLGVALATLLSVLPILALALRAGRGGGFAQAANWLGGSVRSSLVAGACAASIVTAVGVVVGWALARRRRGVRLVDGLMSLSFIMPAAVLGVGLIATWNRPATGFVYGTTAILVVGYVARYSVIGARPIAAAIAQSPVSYEEAAAALGVGFVRRFVRLVLPLHARAIAGAWLLVMAFCLRDLETAVLYYPPGGETLPVRIFTLEANGPEPVVAALAVVLVVLTGSVLAAGALLSRRRYG